MKRAVVEVQRVCVGDIEDCDVGFEGARPRRRRKLNDEGELDHAPRTLQLI